jgi:hypothetical protein
MAILCSKITCVNKDINFNIWKGRFCITTRKFWRPCQVKHNWRFTQFLEAKGRIEVGGEAILRGHSDLSLFCKPVSSASLPSDPGASRIFKTQMCHSNTLPLWSKILQRAKSGQRKWAARGEGMTGTDRNAGWPCGPSLWCKDHLWEWLGLWHPQSTTGNSTLGSTTNRCKVHEEWMRAEGVP